MIRARVPSGGPILLLAPVRGLTSEADPTLGAIEEHGPAAVGIGISPEEFRGLSEYFVTSEAEPVVPLTSVELSEVRGLVRFGEVRVPNPTFLAVARWSIARGTPIEALDPSEDRTASLFAEKIGYVELVRRTVKERGVARRPPTPATPDEFALAWDREIASGRGSREFAAARDRHLARGARRLARAHGRVAVVVDRERFDGVRSLLASEPAPAMEPE